MPDFHYIPNNVYHWGVRPILFSIGHINIYAYPFFNLLALIAGLSVYRFLKKESHSDENSWQSSLVAFGAIFGGMLGAILLGNVFNLRNFFMTLPFSLFSARTITGGILGGLFGTWVVKTVFGIRGHFGNLFAPALAIAIAVGRLGCFFRGCCYGVPTGCGLGIDFGDGIPRHPTQLYELFFMLGLFFYLMKKRKTARPGELFIIFGISYFAFRFFEEFLRVSPHIWGLTVFQWISLFGIIVFVIRYRRVLSNRKP